MPSWPTVVDIAVAGDAARCGGKAAGLAGLAHAGFAVPAAICLTTDFYLRWLETSEISVEIAGLCANPVRSEPGVLRDLLAKLRVRVEVAAVDAELQAALADGLARLGPGTLSVRSSGVDEDNVGASHAGIHASFVVAGAADVLDAVRRCWASLWSEAAWTYRERLGIPHGAAAMAVVVQRFVAAERAGVAFSADPLTGAPATVVEAGWGTGTALVSGRITPDEYTITPVAAGAPEDVRRRPGAQDVMTTWRDGQERTVPLPDGWRERPVLEPAQARELARLVRAVERALGYPVDVEWVFEGGGFWAVQARPITTLGAPDEQGPPPGTLWTRANLKEVFPDLPSPLALSYLARSLNLMFTTYHAAQGYALPAHAQLVGVFHGRPYLNLSLMQGMTVERGGDPAVVSRLFGGAGGAPAVPAAGPRSRPGRADQLRLAREMLATFFRTPYRGRRLFRKLRRQGLALRTLPLERLSDRVLVAHLERLRATLLHERTLGRLHEVVSAQSRAYMALEVLLRAWTDGDSETLLKRLMTGLGTLPNVRMTYRLMALGALAARDARARAFFEAERGPEAERGYRTALAGSEFLAGLDDFMAEFGHRGPYESDVMSPRFAEDPTPLFRIIELYVRAGVREDPARHAAERRDIRARATEDVRRALRRGRGRLGYALRWAVFSVACAALQRLLALRDECRHVTTLLVAHLRGVTLELGRRATAAGGLTAADDVFFLEWDELPRVLDAPEQDWRGLARRRRLARQRHERLAAPDLLGGEAAALPSAGQEGDELNGFGVSPGTVTGIVRIVRSPAQDLRGLRGEIVVFPAIEPTLTPVFPLVSGLIAEMGGLLSHAAILAREYGLPAVVSVREATRRLRDGDRVELNGTTGQIRVLARAAGVSGSRRA